jgi:hypothetical protein
VAVALAGGQNKNLIVNHQIKRLRILRYEKMERKKKDKT